MATHEEIAEIIADLSKKQEKILAAIDANDGVAHTNQITSATELTNQDVGYHAKGELTSKRLLKKIGAVEIDRGGKDPNQYRLTELGEEVASELRREHPTPRKDEIDDERIKSVERDIDRLFRLLGDLEETSEIHHEALVELRDRVEDVEADLS